MNTIDNIKIQHKNDVPLQPLRLHPHLSELTRQRENSLLFWQELDQDHHATCCEVKKEKGDTSTTSSSSTTEKHEGWLMEVRHIQWILWQDGKRKCWIKAISSIRKWWLVLTCLRCVRWLATFIAVSIKRKRRIRTVEVLTTLSLTVRLLRVIFAGSILWRALLGNLLHNPFLLFHWYCLYFSKSIHKLLHWQCASFLKFYHQKWMVLPTIHSFCQYSSLLGDDWKLLTCDCLK